ncbi:rhamnan synthesis F family protein [Agrobacterium vitis]|uniref:rhamnan synthesis F family protein n=1 Tax=Rhizobium/Agrobacterium group TaxID=227290 RepID=UPI0018D23D88|nr:MULTISPECIES: rhamnan synthesis F family protein [Rhizobium/Agrobacterium group]
MKAAVFAHFDIHNVVDEHVMYTLKCYRPYFDIIHFVTTSDIDKFEYNKISQLVDRVIVRRNIGYDFMSWKIGVEALPLNICSEVAFINDSCYGPVVNPENIFDFGRKSGADFWGVSLNRQFVDHIQSNFMVFGVNLIRSGFLSQFWRSIRVIPNKFELILKYEVGLTERIAQAGYKVAALVDVDFDNLEVVRRIRQDDYGEDLRYFTNIEPFDGQQNPLQVGWGEALRLGSPLVKVELLRDNPVGANRKAIINRLRDMNWYDVNLIRNHLSRTVNFNQFEIISQAF